jgi:hypothetical protein
MMAAFSDASLFPASRIRLSSLSEIIWNRNYVANVQLTVSGEFGIGGRGGFYETPGCLRDVIPEDEPGQETPRERLLGEAMMWAKRGSQRRLQMMRKR